MKEQVKIPNYQYEVEEYDCLYIKPLPVNKNKPVQIWKGDRFSWIAIYDKDLKEIDVYDVITIIGRINIDYHLDKKMFRLFSQRGKIYFDRCICKIIGDLED